MPSSHIVPHPLDDLPVKYVLYTHYAHPNQQENYKIWEKKSKSVDIRTLDSYKYLASHLRGLQELLDTSPQEGLLVIFYDPGFAECLEGIAEKKTREGLQSECKKLQFAEKFRDAIDKEMQRYGRLSKRVRFVTPLDLCDIFGRMDWTKAEKLRWWFIGPTTSIRYDTPKIVEAIVRVRLIGSGVPLFRIDWDVIFRGEENKDIESLGLFKPITQCLQAFRLRRDDARLATFLFSGGYNVRDVCDEARTKNFDAWRGAFATRIFPAIGVNKDLAIQAQRKSDRGNKKAWEKYARKCFDKDLAYRFYGLHLTDHGLEVAADYKNGIGYFGANPLVSVISGAFFCLSDSAIIELPPFSNLGLNVSWIDDHLKYCLHRELRHLTTVTLAEEPLLSDAKIDCIMVDKWRAPVTNLPFYAFGVYLPTVLWGAVMDSWITEDPIHKFRPESLPETDREKWNANRTGLSTAVLAGALQAAIQRATPSSTERFQLKERLMNAALRRISIVRRAWAHLKNKKMQTFASVWVTGAVRKYFPPNDFPNLKGRCLGLVAHKNVPVDVEFTRENMSEYINPWIQNDLHQLVDDAYEYIEWTLAWPAITHVIRSVEPGKLRTDLSWPRL